MSDHLAALTEYIRERYPEGQFLYKSCSTTDDSWIVILQPEGEYATTQSRLLVDNPSRKYAKFRASELKVVDIIHKFDKTKETDSVRNSIYTKKPQIEYTKGVSVKSDTFDTNVYEVCSGGIHFFESIEAAFYYELRSLPDYTGYWIGRYNDGQKKNEGMCVSGGRSDHWIFWHENGQKECEGDYLNGKKTGLWIIWHIDGQKTREGSYLNGNKTGHWIKWHDNGEKESEGDYSKDLRTGYWIHFHENGQKSAEGNYSYGERTGHWIIWNRQGQKSCEGDYLDGKKTGHWIIWSRQGQKSEVNYLNEGAQTTQ